ncbi:exopolysaccharide production protein ExoQ [Microbacteriaceae bacterium SG_E_30_P1]|uniref:Exopolysaccharide production protein ExoQ n=1 Tax=Antiquaquibacter oligotrophicus TaxID=2880260 RepID=A0ABT6KNX5_9MICO|nr:O-antigen ligase family protein [Antiquaquibacter oligotrophicus]MDH6181696.1 exopolysaccharide production protein ExoQ [Antiquaquibacter oligotrophicus]UDF12620.1 O-antigen ligase family protein [Antiquaquibacter oligotrophicus]
MRFLSDPRWRSGFLVLVLLLAMAPDAWRLSVGWWVFGVVSVLVFLACIVILIAQRGRWRISELPYPLLAFLVLATLSILWSHYPSATALGLLTTWMLVVAGVTLAVTYSWPELLRGLSRVLRFVLATSLLFELFVSLVIRAPLLPLTQQVNANPEDYDGRIPPLLYWSRNELFEVFDDGRIQGIVGNSNHLGFLALLALLVFAIELADRRRRRAASIAWIALAVVMLALSRSATVTVALVGTLAIIGVVLLLRRRDSPRARTITYASLAAAGALVTTAVIAFPAAIIRALGRDTDLTGRLDIWDSVIALAQQRPAFGWGWVSYWVPWADPFHDLAFSNKVRMLQAHNAWLDVWFQLGIVGLIVFAALVISTLARTWAFAVDRQQVVPGQPLKHTALTLLPFAIMVALIIQSVAESRLLVEFGIMFLTLIAVSTKRNEPLIEQPRDARE